MLIRISVGADADLADEDQGDTLHDLYHWLRQDTDVRRVADVRPGEDESGSGAMGALEYINVTCTVLSVLVSAYSAWRATRPSDPSVHLTVNGTTVVLGDASPETLRRAAAQLEESAGDTGEPET